MRSLWLVLTVPLIGCGAPAVRAPQLPMQVPEQWSSTSAGEPLGWWSSFPDESVQQLVAEALENNLDLSAAASRLSAAGHEARIAGASLLPQISAGGSASRQQQVFVGLPVLGAADPLTSHSTTYGVSLNAAWELDLWGRLRARRSAAVADAQAAAADFEGARLSLAAQTLKASFSAIEAQRQYQLADESAQAYERTVDGIRERYARGVRPSIDLRLALVDQANADLGRQQSLLVQDRSLRQLEILLGRYPSAEVLLASDLPDLLAPVPADLTVDLLTRRPDIVAAERRLAASGQRVSESKRSLLPSISLTGSAGRTSGELSDLNSGDFSVWGILGSITQPLFQGGRLVAQVSRAGSLEDQALAQYASVVLRACAEVEGALAADDILREQESVARVAAEHAASAHDLARTRYELGLDNVLTMLTAQRANVGARSRLLQVRLARLHARVDLHLALGGGFVLPAGDPS